MLEGCLFESIRLATWRRAAGLWPVAVSVLCATARATAFLHRADPSVCRCATGVAHAQSKRMRSARISIGCIVMPGSDVALTAGDDPPIGTGGTVTSVPWSHVEKSVRCMVAATLTPFMSMSVMDVTRAPAGSTLPSCTATGTASGPSPMSNRCCRRSNISPRWCTVRVCRWTLGGSRLVACSDRYGNGCVLPDGAPKRMRGMCVMRCDCRRIAVVRVPCASLNTMRDVVSTRVRSLSGSPTPRLSS
mmetsp:Transcript_9113/g.28261  ORF Transcript_9113/g.28261 Transcript_9113/m.28261 type:complete len:247 (-) Transcript_9113:3004-3744(-)